MAYTQAGVAEDADAKNTAHIKTLWDRNFGEEFKKRLYRSIFQQLIVSAVYEQVEYLRVDNGYGRVGYRFGTKNGVVDIYV